MTKDHRHPTPDWNPYLAGLALGGVLLAAFVIMGRGLGASGAFKAGAAACVATLAPAATAAHGWFPDRTPLLGEWLVPEMAGVLLGAGLAGMVGRRGRWVIERGPSCTVPVRLGCAFAGGMLMAVGARMAGGCTSGQGLTGGALLNAGSWMVMGALFLGAYALAWPLRRLWR